MALTTKNHSEVVEGSRHAPHNLTYPDAANRIAGTNEGKSIVVDATNMYQLAKQDDDDSLWMMVDDAPLTWLEIETGIGNNLDVGYDNFGANPAIVDIDNAEGQGDLRLKPAGDFSLVVDISGCTNTSDGFSVVNGADQFDLIRKGADDMDLDADLGEFNIAAASASLLTVDTGALTISTTTSGTLLFDAVALLDINAGANLDIDVTGLTTLDFTGGDATITPAGDFSLVVDLSSCTNAADGFFIIDGSDNFNLIHKSANDLDLDADLGEFNISAASASLITVGNSGTLTLQTTGANGGGHVIVNALNQFNVNAQDCFIDTTSAISLDAAAASNFTVNSANLTLSTTISGTLLIDAVAILDINAADLDIDASASIAIDAATTIEWSGTNAALTSGGALAIDGEFTLTGGGSILSTDNGNLLLTPHGTGITVIGTGAGTYGLNAPGDLFVSAELEVASTSFLGGVVQAYSFIHMFAGTQLRAGFQLYSGDGLHLFLDDTLGRQNNNLIVTTDSNRSKNHDHSTLSDHPTTFHHSSTDVDTDNTEFSTDRWNEQTIGGGAGSYCGLKSITEEVTIPVGEGAAPVVVSTLNLVPATSRITQVMTRITQAPGGGATTLDVGRTNGGNLDEYADGTAVALNTTTIADDDGDGNTALPHWQTAADTLTLTTDLDVTGTDMKVRIVVFYEESTVPTA